MKFPAKLIFPRMSLDEPPTYTESDIEVVVRDILMVVESAEYMTRESLAAALRARYGIKKEAPGPVPPPRPRYKEVG